jgi:large subunit ribosomal protein L30
MKITLVRSLIGVKKDQVATVRALGLRKTGDSRVVQDSPDVQGMVRKVAFLLEVEGVGPA